MAYVRCGKKIVLVSGQIVQGSPDTISENASVSRQGDKCRLGCGKVGRLTQRLTSKTYVNSRRVGLFYSGITGPGILRGWVARAGRSVFAA